ncbi:MAG TPA: hypothetical protein VHC19_14865 [Pirellulales bacterium]|nr:hypothetical protein [Pirellulales bacterium]
MLRLSMLSLAVLAVLTVGFANAKDSDKDKQDKNQCQFQATVSKVDEQKNSITVKSMDDNDKEQKQTLRLADDAQILDSQGKQTELDSFEPGDDVCITEEGDKVTELRKHAEATITNVNPQAGTITVKMEGKNGKETEKTFRLIEDAEYLDSEGHVAVLDVFRSGDQILIIESEGTVKAMKKGHGEHASKKSQQSRDKKSNDKA